jgi:predicted ATPase
LIAKLALTNFKAFASVEIPMAPYTLLSGLNSSGKSTVLQALALLRQGGDIALNGIPLNGELVELGTGQDVLHEDYSAEPGAEPEVRFRMTSNTGEVYELGLGYGRDYDFLPIVDTAGPCCAM